MHQASHFGKHYPTELFLSCGVPVSLLSRHWGLCHVPLLLSQVYQSSRGFQSCGPMKGSTPVPPCFSLLEGFQSMQLISESCKAPVLKQLFWLPFMAFQFLKLWVSTGSLEVGKAECQAVCYTPELFPSSGSWTKVSHRLQFFVSTIRFYFRTLLNQHASGLW